MSRRALARLSRTARAVLIVDDDEFLARALARDFHDAGWSVAVAADCDAALAAADARPPDLAVVDLCMPGRSGLELLDELAARHPSTRTVVVTGYYSVDAAVDAMRLGALDYLTKPVRRDDVLAAFHRDVERAAPSSGPTLAEAQRRHIERVLADCGGNVSQAARMLGLARRSLQRKLRRS